MTKAISVLLLLAMAGCSGLPRSQHAASRCDASEAAYQCQVERYENAP